jgi:hypothetical protein
MLHITTSKPTLRTHRTSQYGSFAMLDFSLYCTSLNSSHERSEV